jgi:hypothetical protein
MIEDTQMTWKGRLKRSCAYAIAVVSASTVVVLALSSLEHSGTSREIDIASFVLGLPLGPGALVSFGIFGTPGPCASNGQIVGFFLIPFVSVVVDAGLIFAVWEFFHRKRSRGLDSDGILHING